MRNIRLVLAAAVVSAMAVRVQAAAPVTPAATTTAAATAPATSATSVPATMSAQEMAAKKTLGNFFHGMFRGDKAAFDYLVYTDPKNKAVAEVMFGEIMAEQRVRAAVVAAFGADKAKSFDLGMGEAEEKDFEKELSNATVKLNDKGDSADIQMGPGPTFVVVKKGDKWMVDFDKTQANMGPMPQGVEFKTLSGKIAGYDQLAKDVSDKKFGTVADVTKQVDKIDTEAEAKAAESQPATAPQP